MFLQLPSIKRGKRREEREFWEAFRQLQPKILGGLLDALVGGMRALPSVKINDLPRMADFARFGEAVVRGLGLPADTFLAAYRMNRREATASTLEDSLVGTVLLEVVAMCNGEIDWTDSPGVFLMQLTRRVGPRIAKSPGWPKTPAMLGTEMRRVAPQLREHGIFLIFGKTHESRTITLTAGPSSDDADYSAATP